MRDFDNWLFSVLVWIKMNKCYDFVLNYTVHIYHKFKPNQTYHQNFRQTVFFLGTLCTFIEESINKKRNEYQLWKKDFNLIQIQVWRFAIGFRKKSSGTINWPFTLWEDKYVTTVLNYYRSALKCAPFTQNQPIVLNVFSP